MRNGYYLYAYIEINEYANYYKTDTKRHDQNISLWKYSDDEELEKEMDMYALTDWQKEEVRKGNYAPWNFEEDGDLEEDDYYYEDDK